MHFFHFLKSSYYCTVLLIPLYLFRVIIPQVTEVDRVASDSALTARALAVTQMEQNSSNNNNTPNPSNRVEIRNRKNNKSLKNSNLPRMKRRRSKLLRKK